MTVKLQRFGNLFNPVFWSPFWIVLPFIAIFYINKDPAYGIALSILFFALKFLVAPLEYPKEFTADYEMIKFTAPYYLKNKYGRGGRNIKVKYEITHITEIELKSNRFEKLFGLAHLEFVGYTYHDAGRYTDRVEPKGRHVLYGISIKKHKRGIDAFISSLGLSNDSL